MRETGHHGRGPHVRSPSGSLRGCASVWMRRDTVSRARPRISGTSRLGYGHRPRITLENPVYPFESNLFHLRLSRTWIGRGFRWKRHFRKAVRVLERRNPPRAIALLQHLNLNSLSRFWNPRRCLRTLHGPADVSECNITSKKPDLHIVDCQHAVTEDDGVGTGEVCLDLASTLPPPAHDIHKVAIVCEQRGICFCIMAIPRLLLP